MKPVLRIVLIVSLAFNIFFVLGFFQAGKQEKRAKTLEGRARIMAAKLSLDQQQNELFEELLTDFTQLRQDRTDQRSEFYSELIKDKPNEKRLKDFCVGKSARKHRLDTLALMQRFIGILRPQQREMFLEIVNSRNSSKQSSQTPSEK